MGFRLLAHKGQDVKRDLAALDGNFDIAVIGGGIYGAWTAYCAALRGFHVALIERDDWASGTSSASSKLIHGGLRYLEQFHVGLVRTSLDERRRLSRLGPHRVSPLRFMIPVYTDTPIGALRMRAGLWLYDRIGGVGQPVAGHRAHSRSEVLKRYPFLRSDGLQRGFSYGDCMTDDARFTLEIVAGAEASGAVTVNHAEVTAVAHPSGGIRSMGIIDRLTGNSHTARARVVVNTSGPWLGRFSPSAMRMTKGVHLVMPALATPDAFLLMSEGDGRVFFMIPWYGKTILGTTDTDFSGDADQVSVDDTDIDYLLTNAARYVSGWGREEIQGAFVGIRTLQDKSGVAPSTVTREWTLEDSGDGILTSIGGKLTSARADAETIVDRASSILGRDTHPVSSDRPLPWCPDGGFDEWSAARVAEGRHLGINDDVATHLPRRYGNTVDKIFGMISTDPALSARLAPNLPFCKAEVIHAAREEMALTLEDVVRRRIPMALLTRLDSDSLQSVADLLATVLDWSNDRRDAEIETTLAATPYHALLR